MAELPGLGGATSKTINRVSAMTLIIPVKQGLTAPLVIGEHDIGYDPDAPPVRFADNLRVALEGVQHLVANGHVNALNEVATIHYARWVLINDDQNLLFCANFDTSLDQYLRDFMTIANVHQKGHVPWMDLVWGPCVGYPGDDSDAFIAWARSWQFDTTLFFPTISDLTVRDVSWLRKFKHIYDDFDQCAQEVDPSLWPPELRAAFDHFKKRVNAIEVQVVPS